MRPASSSPPPSSPPGEAAPAAGPPPAGPLPLPPGAAGGSLVAYVEAFVSTVKTLMADLSARYPHDPLVDRMKKRIALAADICPITLVEFVGSHLYPYRERIYGEDDSFFLDNAYEEEFERATDAEKVAIASHLVPKVKQAWRDATLDEREIYAELVQSLLDDYIEYLSIQVEGPAP